VKEFRKSVKIPVTAIDLGGPVFFNGTRCINVALWPGC